MDRKEKNRNEKNRKEKKKKQKKEKSLKLHYYTTKQLVSDESEQLEKSCLTEEHEQQLHQVGYLSDGSQNSKKRRREASPAVESHIKGLCFFFPVDKINGVLNLYILHYMY